jgi:HlyD family secretion protein
MIKWISIALALAGLGVGIAVVTTSTIDPPQIDPAARPSINPFGKGIAAAGMVEAATRNIELSAPEPGTVGEVLVQVNDAVTEGQPLFKMDARLLEAERLRAVAAQGVAEANHARLKSLPREEDLAPLRAVIAGARARYGDASAEYDNARQVHANRAASSAEVEHRRNAMLVAKAALDQAEAEYRRVNAGASEQELAVAVAQVNEARALVEAIEMRIERLTVRSPIAGSVLRREVEPGEFLGGAMSGPAMVVGDLAQMHIRAQVDEEDLVRLNDGAKAVAVVRSATRPEVPLEQIRIEPMAVPKQQLLNLPTELVDTRVVQVVYRVKGDQPVRLFPGQMVDVFIATSD